MFIRIALLLRHHLGDGADGAALHAARPRDLRPRPDPASSAACSCIAKSTHEIHDKLEGEEEHGVGAQGAPSFAGVIVQILLLDIVFSLDSVITAVGMAEHVAVMIVAVVIAVGVMLLSARAISDFVERHPTVKMLALSFLLLIGVSLIGEGLGQHIPKGYIYFAMGFSVFVEMINLRVRAKQAPVHLRQQAPE